MIRLGEGPWFILDLANNHQGDVEHAREIIRRCGEVVRAAGARAMFKFQFRQLDTLVHAAHRQGSDNKHIPRFLATRLDVEAYGELARAVREAGMVTMATPFDEGSLEWIGALDIEVVKIASCSGADRPLLDAVAGCGRPVVASTGGLTLSQVDYLVNRLGGRAPEFALMHCVGIYPTPRDKMRLNQIALLRHRYPGVAVGWSTHEDPEDTVSVQLAHARGARLFERHVGLRTEKHALNAYSSTPEQIAAWIGAQARAAEACGGGQRAPSPPEEMESLRSLARGVYAARAVKRGHPLLREDVYFAMPCGAGQMTSGQFTEGVSADRDYGVDEAVPATQARPGHTREQILFDILLQTRGILNHAGLVVGRSSTIDVSHHYGLERFREFGCVIVNCINRVYCKKLIVVLPRQKHPYHYHKIKEESFQLLWGDLEVEIDGDRRRLEVGDIVLVEPGCWHKFHSLDGAVFEEVSTTHLNDDSYYEDEQIALRPRESRKTELPNWEAALAEGRFPG